MWGLEHTCMAVSVALLALWLIWRQNYSWLAAALVSQVPFWGGSTAYFVTGITAPVNINLSLDLIVAGYFVVSALSLQAKGGSGKVQIHLGIVFIVATIFDLFNIVVSFPTYSITHEALHYIALAIVGLRAYVRQFDFSHRRYRGGVRSKDGGGLV